MMLWSWIGLAVGLFCLARGGLDLRERRYVWGGLGVIAGLSLLLVPIPAHAVKFDLPAVSAR